MKTTFRQCDRLHFILRVWAQVAQSNAWSFWPQVTEVSWRFPPFLHLGGRASRNTPRSPGEIRPLKPHCHCCFPHRWHIMTMFPRKQQNLLAALLHVLPNRKQIEINWNFAKNLMTLLYFHLKSSALIASHMPRVEGMTTRSLHQIHVVHSKSGERASFV